LRTTVIEFKAWAVGWTYADGQDRLRDCEETSDDRPMEVMCHGGGAAKTAASARRTAEALAGRRSQRRDRCRTSRKRAGRRRDGGDVAIAHIDSGRILTSVRKFADSVDGVDVLINKPACWPAADTHGGWMRHP